MSERLLTAIAKLKFGTLGDVISAAGVFESNEKKQAVDALEKLVDEGKVVVTAKGKYSLPKREKETDYSVFIDEKPELVLGEVPSGFVRGKLINKGKFGFVRPENGGRDILIPDRRCFGHGMHGDIVLCRVFDDRETRFLANRNQRKGGRMSRVSNFDDNRESGEVVKIIERGSTEVVGTFYNEGMYMHVIPDDLGIEEILIESNDIGAKSNQKVLVKITGFPSVTAMTSGEITEVLGEAGDVWVSTLSVVRAFGYQTEFPDTVKAEIEKVAVPIAEKDLKKRADFRKDLVITIDGDDARDFDDAVFLVKDAEGFYHLDVHIADVSHYVKRNGAVDREALRRATSVYFPDFVIPMLPEELSNELCSLKPNEPRLTISVSMVLDSKGEIVKFDVQKGVIKSAYRMTYDKVTRILEGDAELTREYKDIVPMLETMAELADILIKRRDRKGQLDFDLPETKIVVDENYHTVDVVKAPRDISHRVIEQFMVTTNEVVAEWMCRMEIPFVYRVHDKPDLAKMKELADFLFIFGVKLNAKDFSDVHSKQIQKVLKEIEGKPFENVVNEITIRSMKKAEYSPDCRGHYGLASKFYCHFTSPIRRYPDLAIHRIITLFLENRLSQNPEHYPWLTDFVNVASRHSSVKEREADEVEREVDKLKVAEFMQSKIGEEFNGVISGVTEKGVFVKLDNTAEGFISVERLPSKGYSFEPKKFRLVPSKGKIFMLGDNIRIKVSDVDLVLRRIGFEYVDENILDAPCEEIKSQGGGCSPTNIFFAPER